MKTNFIYLFINFFFFNKLFFIDEELIISLSFFIIFFNLFFLLSEYLIKFLDKRSFNILTGFLNYYNLYLEYIGTLKKFHKVRSRKYFIINFFNFIFLPFLSQISMFYFLLLNFRKLKIDELFLDIIVKVSKNEINDLKVILLKNF